jgi:hypothetical protein
MATYGEPLRMSDCCIRILGGKGTPGLGELEADSLH